MFSRETSGKRYYVTYKAFSSVKFAPNDAYNMAQVRTLGLLIGHFVPLNLSVIHMSTEFSPVHSKKYSYGSSFISGLGKFFELFVDVFYFPI